MVGRGGLGRGPEGLVGGIGVVGLWVGQGGLWIGRGARLWVPSGAWYAVEELGENSANSGPNLTNVGSLEREEP